MGFRGSIIACAAAAALFAPAWAQAAVVNGSFEHNLDGWTANHELVQVPGGIFHRDPGHVADYEYAPVDGYFFALLNADAADTPTLLSQTFNTRGGLFTGSAAFLGEDDLPYDDFGFVRIFDAESEIQIFSTQLFSASIGSLGNYGYTPWTPFSAYLAAGRYTIEAGVANGVDASGPSYLLVDNFAVREVPEPATWALMLTGFFGMGAALRRRSLRPVRVRRG